MTDQKYSYISIEPDDDEIVIQAGASYGARAVMPESVAVPEPVVAPAPAPATPAKKTKELYREATLDDLENFEISKMQKIIIIVAAIGLVVGIALLIIYFI